VKLQSIWKSGSSRICHSKSGYHSKSGKIRLRPGLEKNKSGTALQRTDVILTTALASSTKLQCFN